MKKRAWFAPKEDHYYRSSCNNNSSPQAKGKDLQGMVETQRSNSGSDEHKNEPDGLVILFCDWDNDVWLTSADIFGQKG